MKLYIAFIALICISSIFAARHRNSKKWKNHKAKNKLNFTNEAKEIEKFEIFEKVDHFIEFTNNKSSLGFEVGHNKFSTYNEKELNQLNGLILSNHTLVKDGKRGINNRVIYTLGPFGPEFNEFEAEYENIPETVDWSNIWDAPVRDQLLCGSCYSFSTTGAIEAQIFLKKGQTVLLAPQEIKDCSDNNGCRGGIVPSVFAYAMRNGVCLESDYPYTTPQTQCSNSRCRSKLKISKFFSIKPNCERSLMEALAKHGPIAVAIDGENETFKRYKRGVFSRRGNVQCTKRVNHAVLLVGYGVKDGEKVWKIKNSWGRTWGEDGFGYISREDPNTCGILTESFAPIL